MVQCCSMQHNNAIRARHNSLKNNFKLVTYLMLREQHHLKSFASVESWCWTSMDCTPCGTVVLSQEIVLTRMVNLMRDNSEMYCTEYLNTCSSDTGKWRLTWLKWGALHLPTVDNIPNSELSILSKLTQRHLCNCVTRWTYVERTSATITFLTQLARASWGLRGCGFPLLCLRYLSFKLGASAE